MVKKESTMAVLPPHKNFPVETVYFVEFLTAINRTFEFTHQS